MKRDHEKANSLNQNEVTLTNENGRFRFQCRNCDKKTHIRRNKKKSCQGVRSGRKKCFKWKCKVFNAIIVIKTSVPKSMLEDIKRNHVKKNLRTKMRK